MLRTGLGARRGLSLMEILVSFMIMTIGIISVISLFPVGISRMQDAVRSTRSTIQAMSAASTVQSQNWANDDLLWRPPANPNSVPYPPGTVDNNAFATIFGYQGPGTILAKFPVVSPGPGFPVLVDPLLAAASEFQGDPAILYKRVWIGSVAAPGGTSFAAMGTPTPIAPFTTTLFDLPIYSLSHAYLMPAGWRREAYLRRWFFSDSDLRYEPTNPAIPVDPRRTAAPPEWTFYQSQLTEIDNGATAQRDPSYSWAFVIADSIGQGRAVAADPTNTFLLPPPNDAVPKTSIRVMIFQNRNLAQPYSLVRGCFFDGSSIATLSWPMGAQRPTVLRGTWLMEYTNSGSTRTGAGFTHRQKLLFHKVVGFKEPEVDSTGQWFQVVNLEQAVVDPDLPGHAQGDLRALPDGLTNPGTAVTSTFPVNADPIPDSTIVWTPVIIWDGLKEVFEVNN